MATAKGAVIIVSLAAAAAIAVYESPELRRWAEHCRRQMAITMRSIQDDINNSRQQRRARQQQPRFNRPEDAEGFMQSSAEPFPGVDGDDESKRRQREELMYWNSIRLEKIEKEKQQRAEFEKSRAPSTDFDHFLHPDPNATEKGTYVYNSGADVHNADEGLRRRPDTAARGFQRGALYANPFADENGIEMEEREDDRLMASGMSDGIYSVSDAPPVGSRTPVPASSASSVTMATPEASIIDENEANDYIRYSTISQPITERETASVYEAAPSEYSTISRSEPPSAYANIQAWADSTASLQSPLPQPPSLTPLQAQSPAAVFSPIQPASLSGNGHQSPWQSASSSIAELDPAPFYSPLPTASRPVTEPDAELASAFLKPAAHSDDEDDEEGDGMLTPTDSMSVAEEVTRDDLSEAASRRLDILSDDDFGSRSGAGMSTPGTWTEVGSVVSENEHEHVGAHQGTNGRAVAQ